MKERLQSIVIRQFRGHLVSISERPDLNEAVAARSGRSACGVQVLNLYTNE